MMRLRSGGRCSRLKPSPRQNSVGGVERSTSRTNPGRGITSLLAARQGAGAPPVPNRGFASKRRDLTRVSSNFTPQVEGDLGGAAPAGGRRMGDGVDVVDERVRRAQPTLGLDGVGRVDGEIE